MTAPARITQADMDRAIKAAAKADRARSDAIGTNQRLEVVQPALTPHAFLRHPVAALSNLFATARAHLDRQRQALRALLTKPEKAAADWIRIAGLAALIAFAVLFVFGPITSFLIWLFGRGK